MDDIKFSTLLTPKPVRLASSVKELAEKVNLPPLDHKTNIKMYFHSALTLLQQGRIYQAEGDLENAYVMFMKFVTLAIEVLPKHKGYSTGPDQEKKLLRKKAAEVIPELESIKGQLKQQYEAEDKKKQAEIERQQKEKAEKDYQEQLRKQHEAEREQQRQQEELMKAQQFTQLNHIQSTMEMQQDNALSTFGTTDEFKPYSMPQDLGNLNSSAPQFAAPPQSESALPNADISLVNTQQTPTAPTQDQIVPPWQDMSFQMNSSPAYSNFGMAQPAPPLYMQPQPPLGYSPMMMSPTAQLPMYGSPMAPPAPFTYQSVQPSAPKPPEQLPETPVKPPSFNQSSLSISSISNDDTQTRKMFVDGEIFDQFMALARTNTDKKIETCGILGGTLKQGSFIITTIIIPKQEGTTDTCNMTNEDELFNYQMQNNLMTLGWIHTHPTQDCFLSSVDLHTHSSYQLMLKEAIAIVIAPKFNPNFGIFHMTDTGMAVIPSCERKGFHPHEKGLYNACKHVELKWGNPSFKVVDLRKK